MPEPTRTDQPPSARTEPSVKAPVILLAQGGWWCPSIVERLTSRGACVEDASDLVGLLRLLTARRVSCILLGTRFAGEIGLEVARLLASERSGRDVPIVMIAEDGMLLRPASLAGTRVRYVVTSRVHAGELADCLLRCVAEPRSVAPRAA
ncbi:MAG: hypothetical protein RBS39_10315 [Phycisphaerales bacterium]|jgi:CheY-like chemotaxis protein|nr:hypothetical protein [Phycisphaerales bacterium]